MEDELDVFSSGTVSDRSFDEDHRVRRKVKTYKVMASMHQNKQINKLIVFVITVIIVVTIITIFLKIVRVSCNFNKHVSTVHPSSSSSACC